MTTFWESDKPERETINKMNTLINKLKSKRLRKRISDRISGAVAALSESPPDTETARSLLLKAYALLAQGSFEERIKEVANILDLFGEYTVTVVKN